MFLPLYFAFGAACANEAPMSRPACASPAPLYNFDPMAPPSIVVTLKSSVLDPETAMSLMAKKDGFKIGHRFPPRRYFIEAVTLAMVDALRCEPDVESVGYDLLTTIGWLGAPNNRWRGP